MLLWSWHDICPTCSTSFTYANSYIISQKNTDKYVPQMDNDGFGEDLISDMNLNELLKSPWERGEGVTAMSGVTW